ncbi:MAG: hypothetical protein A2W93_12725 [Bacteroidetes bacterium GWF2_43_63]|nr:MAG: hypothetical protein A2W94_06370 [Bacteroidetes bacterium GWE2_42_42]OFY54647.1 MAG: hypothetical protein A2W93_12725 [Bacteroidetes bacterium GWF2_43_63]HBG71846.1 hypothetical protein [Bacteroidales bacterium]HCB61429.1 hypothetical protein [Bacteroidales bacterium]HCY23336.1 hypothetical protein [Bacteroidales bacterium]
MKTVLNFILVFALMLPLFQSVNAQDSIRFPLSCSIKGPKYGIDSVNGVKNFSLYRENFKQWRDSKYKGEAIKYTLGPWRYCFDNTPLISQNLYLDGVRIVGYMIDNAPDSAAKELCIDTLMLLYDRNIEAFGCARMYGEGYVLGRKGYDLYTYRPQEIELIYYTLEKSIKVQGNESEAAVLSIFYKVTDEMIRAGKLDTAIIYENYDVAMTVAEYQLDIYRQELKANPADSVKINRKIEIYEIAENNINSLFDPWANCEQIIAINSAKFETKKSDLNWLLKLTQLMEKKSCTEDPLYFNAAEELYKQSPTPTSALALGKSFLKIKNFSSAVKYLSEAVGGLEDPIQKAEAYLNLADAYRNLNQFANARNAALQSASLNPNDGRPYLLIGDLYYSTASSCGGETPVSKKAGYWAAADKYAKAKSVSTDENVINAANANYNACYGGFPNSEELFFENISVGSSYTVSCWYTESTVVRSR